MLRTIVETPEFEKRCVKLKLAEDERTALIMDIATNPQSGVSLGREFGNGVMPQKDEVNLEDTGLFSFMSIRTISRYIFYHFLPKMRRAI